MSQIPLQTLISHISHATGLPQFLLCKMGLIIAPFSQGYLSFICPRIPNDICKVLRDLSSIL